MMHNSEIDATNPITMIKLKSEVNKSATMRDLRKKAEKIYKDSHEPEEGIEDFMRGANAMFDLLRLARSSFYCQRDIEGESKCDTQCDHCKEYYSPLETTKPQP